MLVWLRVGGLLLVKRAQNDWYDIVSVIFCSVEMTWRDFSPDSSSSR